MSTPFTPGPWEVEYNEDDGAFSIVMGTYLVDPGCYDPVHYIPLYDGLWPENGDRFKEAQANAHLMASAPEMYTALIRIVAELPSKRDWLDPVTEAMAKGALRKAVSHAE